MPRIRGSILCFLNMTSWRTDYGVTKGHNLKTQEMLHTFTHKEMNMQVELISVLGGNIDLK